MKKYVIVSIKRGDQFEEGFLEDKDKAVKKAIASYHALAESDRKKLEDYYVGLFECEKINGRWFIDENDPEEVVLTLYALQNGVGIECYISTTAENKTFCDLEKAKMYFKKSNQEGSDEDDVKFFNKEINEKIEDADSFVELKNVLESWRSTFEDKNVYEVLFQ